MQLQCFLVFGFGLKKAFQYIPAANPNLVFGMNYFYSALLQSSSSDCIITAASDFERPENTNSRMKALCFGLSVWRGIRGTVTSWSKWHLGSCFQKLLLMHCSTAAGTRALTFTALKYLSKYSEVSIFVAGRLDGHCKSYSLRCLPSQSAGCSRNHTVSCCRNRIKNESLSTSFWEHTNNITIGNECARVPESLPLLAGPACETRKFNPAALY